MIPRGLVPAIIQGDVREVLQRLPDESIHCVVTSPPYWGLRDYGIPPVVSGRGRLLPSRLGGGSPPGGGACPRTYGTSTRSEQGTSERTSAFPRQGAVPDAEHGLASSA